MVFLINIIFCIGVFAGFYSFIRLLMQKQLDFSQLNHFNSPILGSFILTFLFFKLLDTNDLFLALLLTIVSFSTFLFHLSFFYPKISRKIGIGLSIVSITLGSMMVGGAYWYNSIPEKEYVKLESNWESEFRVACVKAVNSELPENLFHDIENVGDLYCSCLIDSLNDELAVKPIVYRLEADLWDQLLDFMTRSVYQSLDSPKFLKCLKPKPQVTI